MELDILGKIIEKTIDQRLITLKTPGIPQRISGKVTKNTITTGIKPTNNPTHVPITTKTGT